MFRAVNGLPGWLFVPLWPVMQLGNLAVGTGAGLAVAWRAGELPVAIGVVARRRPEAGGRAADPPPDHHATSRPRQRPGTSQPGAILRGDDVPASGPSFPSGHVVLIAADHLRRRAGPPGRVGAASRSRSRSGVMVGRVFVGAHNPLDVISGAGAGLMVGGLVAALLPPT